MDTSAEGVPKRTRKRPKISRSGIISVSSMLFQEKGYDRTSLEDIAKELSVTKPSLYYHYASKEDILIDCVRVSYKQFQRELALRDDPKLDGRKRAEIFLRLYFEVITNNNGVSIVIADERVMSPKRGEQYLTWKRELNSDLEGRLQAGVADKSIETPETHITTFAIFGMFNWLAHWRLSGNATNVDQIYDRFIAILFDGIGSKETLV